MHILTPDEIRTEENRAFENGLSYEQMMENAGKGCAEHILKNYPDKNNIVVICGKGKNGGDGFVIARYLSLAGKNVKVLRAFSALSDSLSEKNRQKITPPTQIIEAETPNEEIFDLIKNCDITVDAVFGIGFKGTLPENVKTLFAYANKSECVRIAIDIPSGLSYRNEDFENCFHADETLSMLCYKKEHIYSPYRFICGNVTVIPIGFSVTDGNLHAYGRDEIKNIIPKRRFDGHKGTFGKACIVAGSYKMPGAAVICTKGVLNTGAGLTVLNFPDSIYQSVTSHLSECVFRPLISDKNGELSVSAFDKANTDLENADAVAIGPGLGSGEGVKNFICKTVKTIKSKLIIDADGINNICDNINILKESQAEILLTPHPAEMARLTKKSVAEINGNRIKTAVEFAKEYNVTLLLKGANTVIASPDGKVFINPTGSSALSRGGAGDLLTGIALSLACQGANITDAAVAAAYIHGLAGETAEKKYTAYASSIERITECIPETLSNLFSGT